MVSLKNKPTSICEAKAGACGGRCAILRKQSFWPKNSTGKRASHSSSRFAADIPGSMPAAWDGLRNDGWFNDGWTICGLRDRGLLTSTTIKNTKYLEVTQKDASSKTI